MEEIKKDSQIADSTQSAIGEIGVDVKKPLPRKRTTSLSKEIEKDLPVSLTAEELSKQRAIDARLRLRREWEVESKMVTGVFRDLEVGPGGNLRFSARKYPWDQIESYNFVDGQTYTVPLWVARHLNENCKWPAYRHNIDPSAKEGEKVTQYIGQWNHRFAFVSSEFSGIIKSEAKII